jgi:hypothetical protein
MEKTLAACVGPFHRNVNKPKTNIQTGNQFWHCARDCLH